MKIFTFYKGNWSFIIWYFYAKKLEELPYGKTKYPSYFLIIKFYKMSQTTNADAIIKAL